ncbi:MAG: glycosyltransferase family 8 protein [Oscillospiraceae bacterium]
MNILVTLNSGYIKPLCVMLRSLLYSNPNTFFEIYCINKSLTHEDYAFVDRALSSERYKLNDIKIEDAMLLDAPITDRYPFEMYYRIFASKYLPQTIDKILYLDPDLVVLKPLDELYNMDMGTNYFAAASHVGKHLQKMNEMRLQMETKGPYINSGVMLMNITLLRKEQDFNEVFEYVEKNKSMLFLPDQDIISAIYSDKIIPINPYIYNMTERLVILPHKFGCAVDYKWVRENSAIIHYCGRNKPWKEIYVGFFDEFYKQFAIGLD